MNAVFKKEIRDLIRWVPLGMVASMVLMWMQLPDAVHNATRIAEELVPMTMIVAGAIAIVFGLLQSVFDARSDARGYLMHRPVSANFIFWSKTAAGFTAYAMAMAPSLLMATIYLASKGPEELPTSASQMLPVLWAVLVVFCLHSTMIWILYRDARWVGTKLLPAVGVVGGLALLMLIIYAPPFSDLAVAVACLLVIGTFLLIVSFVAAKHAFVNETRLLSQDSDPWRQRTSGFGVTLSAVVLFGLTVAAVMAIESETFPPTDRLYTTFRLTMSPEGEFHEVSRTIRHGRWDNPGVKIRPAGSNSEFTSVDGEWPEANQVSMIDLSYAAQDPLQPFNYMTITSTSKIPFGQAVLVGYDGRILVYGNSRGLHAVVTPEGTFKSLDEAKGRFKSPRLAGPTAANGQNSYSADTNPLIVDDQAVYQFNSDDLSVTRLLEQSVDASAVMLSEPGRPATLWTQTGDQISEHELAVVNEGEQLPKWRDPDVAATHVFPFPQVKIVASREFNLEPNERPGSISVLRASDGRLALIRVMRADGMELQAEYQFLTESGRADLGAQTVMLPIVTYRNSGEKYIAWMIPPGLVLAVMTYMALSVSTIPPIGLMFFTIPAHALLAAILAFWLACRFELSSQRRWAWAIGSAVLGLGGALAMLSIYRRPLRESCSHCHQLSRVDRDQCQSCGQFWEAPPNEGIEILDSSQPIRDAVGVSS